MPGYAASMASITCARGVGSRARAPAVGGIGHAPGHGQRAHVRFVRPRNLQRRVEEVEDRHRPGGLAFGETRGVLQRVHRRAPERDAVVLERVVELVEGVTALVEQAPDAAIDQARNLGPGVDAAEPEQRIGAHLRRLARLGHQALAQGDHDAVVLGQRARQVPEALAHHVGADGVGRLLHLVVGLLVLACAAAEPAEQARAERGGGRGHREAAGDAARRERVRRHRLRLRAIDLHVLQPEMEPQQHGAGVERPLCHEVALVGVVQGGLPAGVRRQSTDFRVGARG